MPSYRRSQTSVLPAPRSGVLKLLQDQPETFLNVLGMEVDAEGSKYTPGSDSGEWMVIEKLAIPFVPTTRFKTVFTRMQGGARWQSWATMGVYVDNTFTVEGKAEDEQGGSCQTTEEATLTCPFFVYPIVKWQLERSHAKNHVKLQRYFAEQGQAIQGTNTDIHT